MTIRDRILPFAVVGAAFLILALLYGRIVIQNDGISYYGLTVSLLQDGDFDLTNQSQKFPEIRLFQSPVTGRKASQYSCGYALLYAPFVFVSEKIAALIPGSATWRPYPQNTRFPFADSIGVFAGSVLFGLGTVILAAALLRKVYAASWMAGVGAGLAVLLGTSLVFYNFVCPSFAHAADAFLIALAFLLIVLPFENGGGQFWRSALIGFTLALSVLLRNNNIVLLPVLIGGYLVATRRHRPFPAAAYVFAGALPILLLHFYFNWTQYGVFLGTGYHLRENVTTESRLIYFWKLLFHPVAGVFVSSPITLLAIAGLMRGIQQRRLAPAIALASIFVVLCSLSFVGFIFPGGTFGQRLLAHLYIFWVVGVWEFLGWLRKPALALAAATVIWSFLLLNIYLIASTDSSIRKNVLIGYDPVTLVQGAARAREAGMQNDPHDSWFQLWRRSISAYPYPTLQFFLFDSSDSKLRN